MAFAARQPQPAKPRPAVPRLFPGETAVCIGGGPSLTREDVEYCRGRARVVAVNDAYKLAPWADILYAADACWWYWHKGVPEFQGPKYALEKQSIRVNVTVLQNTGIDGLELAPTGLRNGRNSGYQAVGLCHHLGIARIVLLGYDMYGGHWFGNHPNHRSSPYHAFRKYFTTIVKPLEEAGIEVVNATPGSRLECFPKRPLREVL